MDHLGGRVQAQCTPGGGLTDDDLVEGTAKAMKKRILMIEDGRSLVMAVGDRLTAVGYEFESAFDGPTGLEKGPSRFLGFAAG